MENVREVRKANAAYRRAEARATHGRTRDKYAALRARRQLERAVIAILSEDDSQ